MFKQFLNWIFLSIPIYCPWISSSELCKFTIFCPTLTICSQSAQGLRDERELAVREQCFVSTIETKESPSRRCVFPFEYKVSSFNIRLMMVSKMVDRLECSQSLLVYLYIRITSGNLPQSSWFVYSRSGPPDTTVIFTTITASVTMMITSGDGVPAVYKRPQRQRRTMVRHQCSQGRISHHW